MKHEARIRALVDRYEACETTATEEQELRNLLAKEEQLPTDLRAVAVMLVGLDALAEEQLPEQDAPPQSALLPRWWHWAVAAAAMVAVVVVIDHLRTPYCYINGEAIYNREVALASTDCLAKLEHVDHSMEILDALLITND